MFKEWKQKSCCCLFSLRVGTRFIGYIDLAYFVYALVILIMSVGNGFSANIPDRWEWKFSLAHVLAFSVPRCLVFICAARNYLPRVAMQFR